MTQYDNTNRGQIWRNEKKQTDNHPDFTGSLNVNGVEYWVSAWKRKEGAAAKAPALSFSIKPKDEQQSISQRAMPKRLDPISSGRMPAKQNIMPDDDMDGDIIPF
jgi:hypothetical protein